MTDLFIISGGDLEYTKKKYFQNFMVNDAVYILGVYIYKRTEIKLKMKITNK